MNQSVFVGGGALLLIALGAIFSFSNGLRDSSSIVATVVSTRTLSPNAAFSFCAVFEFIGALCLGTAVAATIGTKVFDSATLSASEMIPVSVAALCGAILWGIISWWRAWPASNSHAVLGGLAGAGYATWGFRMIHSRVMLMILLVLFASPAIGFALSMIVTTFLRWVGGWFTTRVRPFVEALHVLSCLSVSCAHGSNNGQLAMGLLLPLMGPMMTTVVPFHLRLLVAAALSTGVFFGGRRIIKRLGMEFYRIRDPQGLSAAFTTAGTVLACVWTGFPASTTQVVAGSIMGAAAAKDAHRVRWPIAYEIVLSWVVTLPASALISYLLLACFRRISGAL